MVILKIRPGRSQCPSIMHAKSIGGIILCEYQCRLPVNHQGFHRGGGAVWDNNHKRMENWEIAAERPNRPRFFLPR